MTTASAYSSVLALIEGYFETMFDSDVERFDQLFAPSAVLHGVADKDLRVLPVPEYRAHLASTPSPKSKGAPRHQEIVLIDFASPTQAIVKVRVRIDTILYLDYLALHSIGDTWRVTAKSYHIEQRF